MRKSEVMNQIRKNKVVAVIRGNSLEEGYNISAACIKGGIISIEVAYTNLNAGAIITKLTEDYPDAFIGAGTVLDPETARNALLAGAKYIVSPAFNADTAKICNRYGVPYLPGCMTITEIITAMESGCEMIKLFPGSTFGTKYISSIKSPLPQASIMVTGGVSLTNAKDWLDAGCDAIGIGGEFNKLGAQGKFDEITKMANDYIAIVGK